MTRKELVARIEHEIRESERLLEQARRCRVVAGNRLVKRAGYSGDVLVKYVRLIEESKDYENAARLLLLELDALDAKEKSNGRP